MAQHDYVIANGTGAAVRSDLNNALAAIVSNNSGATEPVSTYAYMWWPDTTSGNLKFRNGANNAWITIGPLATTGFGFLSSGSTITAALGSASTPGITFTGDTNTGIYSPGADQVAVATSGAGRLFVSSNGRVGVGITPSTTLFHVYTDAPSTASAPTICLEGGVNGYGAGIDFASRTSAGGTLVSMAKITADGEAAWNTTASTQDANLRFFTAADGSLSERLRITSAGLVGIGITSPSFGAIDHGVHIYGSGAQEGVRLETTNGSGGILEIYAENGGNTLDTRGSGYIRFNNAGTEWGRWDSSGRLLVGTSTARTNFNNSTDDPQLQVESANGFGLAAIRNSNSSGGCTIYIAKSRGTGNVVLQNNDVIGGLSYQGNDGSEFVAAAQIACEVDGTPGANDMPGRLVFSTTADGASSPTEQFRVNNQGSVLFGTTDETPFNNNVAGVSIFRRSGHVQMSRDGDTVLGVNRKTNDGSLVVFGQDGTIEGSIAVSGTTVSYNGAHLSRWSQLPSGAERNDILRGSVLSNIDEMCEWSNEENEQLNRMKVSDVEGDKNVSGVFQAWDDDDDTYTNDFYCAMTGDFIIRIAEGVTVQRGDLLMSAGDGTAKPQDDDIIRSKTIAKVTSTTVSCTYEDGSYCVPCVLMAC